MFMVHQNLKRCKLSFIKWIKKEKGKANDEIQIILKEMDYLYSKEGERDWKRWKQRCLNEAYKREEKFWSRKVMVNWLDERDRNTRYFYVVTLERRKKNKIDSLKANDSVEYTGENEIAKKIVRYFESLFSIDHPKDCDEYLEEIPRTVLELMNRNLTKPKAS